MLPLLALIPLITELAPLAAKAIGSALGGGAGKRVAAEIAPVVTDTAVRIFGTDDPASAREAARADPAKAAEFAREMSAAAAQAQAVAAQVRIEEVKAELGNLQSARQTSVDSGLAPEIFRLGQQVLVGDYGIGLLIVVGGLLLLSGVVPLHADPTLVTVVFTLLGTVFGRLSARADQVTNFYYGSSKSSGDKTTEMTTTMRSMGEALGQAAQKQVAPPAPTSSVPPAALPVPADDASSGRAVPVVPAPPGLLAEVMPSLVVPHQHFPEGVSWALTPWGLVVDGGQPERTPGEPATVRKVWARYGDLCCASAKRFGVPVELIVATICTESRGDPSAHREEPQIGDASTGLMQTLRGTAREALGRPSLQQDDLRDPATSIDAGTAYIASQRGATRFDPPLVAAAYNAGSVRKDPAEANRWKLRCFPIGTGRHVDNYAAWLGDCLVVAAQDGWGSGDPAVPSFASCIAGYFQQPDPAAPPAA